MLAPICEKDQSSTTPQRRHGEINKRVHLVHPPIRERQPDGQTEIHWSEENPRLTVYYTGLLLPTYSAGYRTGWRSIKLTFSFSVTPPIPGVNPRLIRFDIVLRLASNDAVDPHLTLNVAWLKVPLTAGVVGDGRGQRWGKLSTIPCCFPVAWRAIT